MNRAVVWLAILSWAGCADRSNYLEPSEGLPHAVFFYEQDRRGENHGISRADDKTPKNGGEVERVPQPALVDIDSVIRILVAKQKLGGQNSPSLRVRARAGPERREKIRAALESLEVLTDLRLAAVRAFKDRDREAFAPARRDFGKAVKGFEAAVLELYERTSEEYRAISRAARDDKTFAAVRQVLTELNQIEDDDRATLRELESKRTTLRIVAFLRPGKDQAALHLEGYDRLPQGELVARDRWGIDLPPEELARIKAQFQASAELAATFNRILDKEVSIREGLREALPILAPELAQLIDEAEELTRRLDSARLDTLKTKAKAYVDHIKATATDLVDATRDRLENTPDTLVEKLKTGSDPVGKLLALVLELKELRDRWQSPTQADLPQLMIDSLGKGRGLIRRADRAPEWVVAVFADGAAILRAGALEIAADVKDAMLGALVESEQAKAFLGELKSIHDDLTAAVALARRLGAMLGIGNAVTSGATRRDVPEAFDVDIDNLENTFLDLKRVPAQSGDLIEVTATLKQPGKDPKSFTAGFKTTRYGWHAKLSPGVVLVRPDQLAGRSNKFRFAPTLAWMHRYSPRPGEGLSLVESIQPGVGIHAAFLDFAADTEVQVGLGLTISFWEDRLQLGAGYNLMSEGNTDGRIYYFIGSDLIGLLQTIGLAK